MNSAGSRQRRAANGSLSARRVQPEGVVAIVCASTPSENELFPEAEKSGLDLDELGAELADRKRELMAELE